MSLYRSYLCWSTYFYVWMIFATGTKGQQSTCSCASGCDERGSNSPGENKVNIAYGKKATMSSTFDDNEEAGPACLAVDGNTSTTYVPGRSWSPPNFPYNCVHSDSGDYYPVWQVDLGQNYTIHNITIYRRSDAVRRMAGGSVYVDSQLCYSFPGYPETSAVNALPEKIEVECTKPLTGRLVSFQKQGYASDLYFINICEVQVWICKTGYVGPQCICGHCKDSVDCGTSRTCPNGCEPGWKSSFCNQSCSAGEYGYDCQQQCGQCQGDTSCDTVSGLCHAGCRPGWTGPYCNQGCPANTYGLNCSLACPDCLEDKICDKVNGTCLQRCPAGVDSSDPYCKRGGDAVAVAIIAGAVAGGVAVVAVIIILAALLIRRRRWSKSSTNSPTSIERDSADRRAQETQSSASASSSGQRKPTVQVKTQVKQAAEKSEDSGHIYSNIGPLATPKPLALSPTATHDHVIHTASYNPEEVDDESTLTMESHVYGNHDDGVYATFKSSKPELDKVQKYLVDRLASRNLQGEFSTIEKKREDLSQKVAMLEENLQKNRFAAIIPYDKCRVVLNDNYTEHGATDFVNASYISGNYSGRQYIAAQGPRDNTVIDFWRTVWQENIIHIIILTNLVEGGKRKCEQYWPEEVGGEESYGPWTVSTTQVECRDSFYIRTLTVKKIGSNASRKITQYHYVCWPDHGVPTTTSLVIFWRYVSSWTRPQNNSSSVPPVLVHCSAGVGRTGTYIGLDLGMDLALTKGSVDVLDLVQRLRNERCLMVQAFDQYIFLHKALLEAYTADDTNLAVDKFDQIYTKPIVSNQPHSRLDKEFQSLTQMLTLSPEPRYDTAKREENRHKNRNPDVLPGDEHLVYLTEYVPGRNEYINAVFMPTFRDPRGNILTQLPLLSTLIDFWRLVYGHSVTTIVSLSSPNEQKKLKHHCQYWPLTEGDTISADPYFIVLERKTQHRDSPLLSYDLILGKKGVSESRQVHLVHYNGWAGEVGGNVSNILHLVDTLVTSHMSSHTRRMVVQCSDGVGKCGLFSALCDIISRMTYDREVDVYMTVRHVQSVTPKAIRSKVQYRYCYQLVQCRAREMSVYANT